MLFRSDVYNLIRAVAPPYPGATAQFAGTEIIIARAQWAELSSPLVAIKPGTVLHGHAGQIVVSCGDGYVIEPLSIIVNAHTLNGAATRTWLSAIALP